MKIINEDIENLKKLGLTSYEARSYITLTSLISATADEISSHTKIPKSKIYNSLKSLANKGFIEIQQERPLIYTANPPLEILKKQKEELDNEIDELIDKLNSNYQSKIIQNPAPIWKINGIEDIIEKEIDMINRANHTIFMRIGFLFENELDQLLDALKRKSIKIKVVLPMKWESKNEIAKKFEEEGIETYFKNLPPVKMMICDSREMLHIYARFDEKNKVIPDSAISILNLYEDVVKHYHKNFEKQVNK